MSPNGVRPAWAWPEWNAIQTQYEQLIDPATSSNRGHNNLSALCIIPVLFSYDYDYNNETVNITSDTLRNFRIFERWSRIKSIKDEVLSLQFRESLASDPNLMRVAVMAVFVNWRASTLGLSWNKMISGIVEDNGIVDFYIHN